MAVSEAISNIPQLLIDKGCQWRKMKTAKEKPITDWEAFGRGYGKRSLAKTRELLIGFIVVGLGGLLFTSFHCRDACHGGHIYAQIPNTEFNHAVLGH